MKMQEDKNIKIDTLPEKKIIKKDKPAIAAPPSNNKIETMQPSCCYGLPMD